ncbi:THUMP domain-containing class I SAM-dependent RNA methyltransferase [Helcococcus massiliensis]|uniref:THUMP domain-containing class I SAM-dependent RNA methyltransferase n=1 Tax=Helcococcus massiliensis TaxID=2040290 RepID=UPI000CDEC6E4|nr:class I SAM-dependent RNA methyltransferase [Helcococcus massiliensis]
MEKIFDILVTSEFGLESVLKQECIDLGFEDLEVSNGKIEFKGNFSDIVKANLWLRTAERVFIKLFEFKALSYDDIYDNVYNFDWENYLSKDGQFIVLGKSHKSKMFSISDNQSITKKAIIDRMRKEYGIDWFNEDKERYKITLSIFEDVASVTLDTSGSGLHKRGYRTKHNLAPLKETMAAGLILLSNWKSETPLVDLFAGSGTIVIEAAMIGKNIAPGISRDFDFKHWKFFDSKYYKEEKLKAYQAINDEDLDIMGFDIDGNAIKIAVENAINASVDDQIKFVVKDVGRVGLKNNFPVIISNPPYGERMGDAEDMDHIYKSIKNHMNTLTTASFYFISSDKDFERKVGHRAVKKRKLFNGRIEVDYYQYPGLDPSLLFGG